MNTPTTPLPVSKRAHGRSFSDFGDLHPAEKILHANCARGEKAEIGDDVPSDGTDRDKVVRASFLRFLLLGGDEQAPVHEKGVQLFGAWIEGQLELENCHVPHGITLSKCKFDLPIITRDLHITGHLSLSGSHLLQGLRADRLKCDSSVFLRDGFKSFAQVSMNGAQIGGSLSCLGGLFEPKEGVALSADRAIIKGSFFLQKPFKATGEVRLLGAQIGGNLACSGGQFEPKEGAALSADRAIIKGGVFLNKQFKATGTVRLPSAEIDNNLTCSAGKFEPKEGHALFAESIVVKGTVFLVDQFKATGEVRLLGAQISGDLDCSSGQFEPKEGDALTTDRAIVKGGVFLNKQFKATGAVSLSGAQIGNNLTCSTGHFEPKEGDALSVNSTVVKGSVLLTKKFKATGSVWFIGAKIDGDLSCIGGQFSARNDDVLHLQTATIKNGLILRDLAAPVRIVATSAQIGVLVDEPRAWAKGSILNGLVYGSLTGTAPTDGARRIAWLKQQSDKDLGEDKSKQGFRPQPWKQLQKVLREMGHEADARLVGIAFEDQLRLADRIGQITDPSKAQNIIPIVRRQCLRGLHWLFGTLAGYGYRPMRLFMSVVVVWLFCAAVYWCLSLPPYNAIGPTDPVVYQHAKYATCTDKEKGNWMLCEALPAEYSTLSPLAYSLDILLPLVDLGQEKSWGPLVPTPERHFCVELFTLSPAHWVRLLNWFEILYGWVASLLFVAIVSGMSRRSEMDK